jgi:hypothetical protein
MISRFLDEVVAGIQAAENSPTEIDDYQYRVAFSIYQKTQVSKWRAMRQLLGDEPIAVVEIDVYEEEIDEENDDDIDDLYL